MDADSQQAISLLDQDGDPLTGRLVRHVVGNCGTYYTITFDPHELGERRSASASTPATTPGARTRRPPSSRFTRDDRDRLTASTTVTTGDLPVPEPPLRPGPLAVTVIDNETAGVVVRESGVGTLVVKCGNATCTIAGHDGRLLAAPDEAAGEPERPRRTPCRRPSRSRSSPTGSSTCTRRRRRHVDQLRVAHRLHFEPIGGYVPSRMFLGNLTFGNGSAAA